MQLVLPSAIHGHRRLLNHAATTTEINYKHRVVDRRQPRFQPTSIIRHKDRFIRANRTRGGRTYFGGRDTHASTEWKLIEAWNVTQIYHGQSSRVTMSLLIFDVEHSSTDSWHSINKLWIPLDSCIWIPLFSIVQERWKHLEYLFNHAF